MSRFRWFINPATGAVNRLRDASGRLFPGAQPGYHGPFVPRFPPPASPPVPDIRRSQPLPIRQPREIDVSFESLFPPDPVARSQASRLEDFVDLRAVGDPASIVEPPVPLSNIRRAQINPDPQDVQFIHPVRDIPGATPATPFDEEKLLRWHPRFHEPRRTKLGLIDGGEIDYVPLTADEILGIRQAIREDPMGSYIAVRQNFDLAETPQDFGRVLEQSRILRRNLAMDPDLEDGLNLAMARAAKRFGVPESKYDEIISPILYRNSPDIPDEVQRKINPTLEEVRAAFTDSDRMRVDTNKAIRKVNKVAELDKFDTVGNGGLIGRALAKGEISESDAVYLANQLNYRRIHLLKQDGMLGPSIKNDVRANSGHRGLEIIPNMSEFSEARKAAIYRAAIQTAETPDEVSQILMMAASDLKSVTFLDDLGGVVDARTVFLARLDGVDATVIPPRVSSTIDEGSIRKANRELEFEQARRSVDDPSRPAFPSESVSAEDTIARGFLTEDGMIVEKLGEGQKWARNADGERIAATVGGGARRSIDSSLLVPPPSPAVPLGSGRMTGFTPEYSGPGSYVPRTIQNAQEADITIAVAVDFETGGELLTAAAADGRVRFVRGINKSGKEAWIADPPYPYGVRSGQYGQVRELEQIDHLARNLDESVESIVTKLNAVAAREGRPVVINGAGNGLGRIRSQDDADSMALHIMDRIVNHPNRKFEIAEVISGGQNGYDVALIKAAKRYGLNTKINPPYTSRGSIMLQEPGNVDGMIFMDPKQYVRHYRLDTAQVGEGIAQSVRSSTGTISSAPSMTMPMNFTDGTRGLRMAPQHSGKSTMDLIIEGNRTGTTRRSLSQFNKADGSPLQVGDVVEFADNQGRKVLVEVTKAPYQLPKSSDPAQMNWYARTWSEYEGWDPSMYDQFADQWQIQYRLLSS